MIDLPDISQARALFLEGPAGAGKTSLAIRRIGMLLEDGVPADQILLLTPQRSYTLPYQEAFGLKEWYALGKATIGGLAQRYVGLFWPLLSDRYAFEAGVEPTFLTYEVAQYFMSRIVSPLIEQGYFTDLKLTRPRLYSQLLDNLNKAAANALPLDELAAYLQAARIKDGSIDTRVNDVAQTVTAYRDFCIARNLLDFSLYLELFWELVKDETPARRHLYSQYRHLIYDQSEEDIPRAHDILREWLPHLESALILYNREAGYRKFLAANPASALTLKATCDQTVTLDEWSGAPPSLNRLRAVLVGAIKDDEVEVEEVEGEELRYHVYSDRLHDGMIDRAVGQIEYLVQQGAQPDDIAVISPYLSDSLHFALASRLDRAGIGHHVHRPSRTLREEPITKVLLTLAVLAHPHWKLDRPSPEAVAHMLMRLLGDADLVRAVLLTNAAYQRADEGLGLAAFEVLPADVRDRVSYMSGQAYDTLRVWLEVYLNGDDLPLDHFFSQVFGEVLSQEGFGFFKDVQAGAQVGNLVDSTRKFRQAVSGILDSETEPAGKAYVQMVQEGVVSGFYQVDWSDVQDAVLIAPVHTFLLRNKPFAYQLWLDVGSTSWHRRIHQPLTNPYVLSKDWNPETEWTFEHEKYFETERLASIVSGLTRRCSHSIYLYVSELSMHGQEQAGELLVALGEAVRKYPR